MSYTITNAPNGLVMWVHEPTGDSGLALTFDAAKRDIIDHHLQQVCFPEALELAKDHPALREVIDAYAKAAEKVIFNPRMGIVTYKCHELHH